MKYLILILSLIAVNSQDLFVPYFGNIPTSPISITRYGGIVGAYDISTLDIAAFQCGGVKKVLLVCIAWETASGQTISSVVWDTAGVAEALTLQKKVDDGVQGLAVYTKIAPTDATSNIRVTLSAASHTVVMSSMLLNNVNQTTPITDLYYNTSGGTTSFTIPARAAASCLTMCVQYDGDPDIIVRSPYTKFNTVSNGILTPTLNHAQTPYIGNIDQDAIWDQLAASSMYGISWILHP